MNISQNSKKGGPFGWVGRGSNTSGRKGVRFKILLFLIADLWGWWGARNADALLSTIRPPADPKGPPFVLFWDIHCRLTDPKPFLKATLAPIYTNFEGEARQKNAPKIVLKVRRRKLGQNRDFLVFWESSKNQFGRPKKKVDKIFEKSPPRENPRSAPGGIP